jgi:hypothetical protein
VLEAVPLELPADLDRADAEIDVFPAQADRLGLADADRALAAAEDEAP